MANPSKFKATISKIVSHGEGIYTVNFSLKNTIAKFKPGQFLHLTLDEFDPSAGFWPESRVFSISSSPGTKEVQILYSVKGAYTDRMSKELKEGKEVWLKLPYGDFIIDKHILDAKKIFLIAGGTGISPFVPFLKSYDRENIGATISVYYGIRNDKFYLYRDLLESLSNRIELNVIKGMMDIGSITDRIILCEAAKCFISGPPIMINSFKESLVAKGFNPENVIIDEWE